MFLIFTSLLFGYIGIHVGGFFGIDYVIGFVGFLSPGLYVLEQVHINVKNQKETNKFVK